MKRTGLIFTPSVEDLSVTLNYLAQLLHDHFQPKARDITRFAGTGCSFEDWFNWEQFSAFTAKGFECQPKPAYRTVFEQHELALLGDLIIYGKEGTPWLVETSLVHGYTQDKWRAKIIADREKLQRAEGTGVRKVQLLLMCSDAEQYLQKTWAYWFEAMPFWSTPDAITCFGDGEQGEVCMLFWQVQ